MVSVLERPKIRLAVTEKNLEEKFVNVKGTVIRYVVAGNKSPLLLVHGFGAFLEVWWKNIGPLSKHFKVYAMDLPGHGLSDRFDSYDIPDLAEVIIGYMDAIGIERADIVGHSMGGLICSALAADYPGRIHRLIIEDGLGVVKGMPFRYRFFTLPLLGEMVMLPTTRGSVERGLRKSFYNAGAVTKEMIETSYQFLKLPGAKRTMLNIIRSGKKYRKLHSTDFLVDRISMIKAPTLVIHGAQDKTISPENAQDTYRIIPGSRLKIFEDCGHCPHIEKAEEYNELVIDFFNEDGLGKEVSSVG